MIDTIHQFFTDGIQAAGNSRQINCRMLVDRRDAQGTVTREWHYYGSTVASFPPLTGDPVTEHSVIQLPSDLSRVPPFKAEEILYSFAKAIAFQEL